MSTNERLRIVRKGHGISQMEAAERLGVSRQTIYRWESGESEPTLENLRSLADLYGMTVDELLNGPAEPDVPEENAAEPPQPSAHTAETQKRPWTRSVLVLLIAAVCVAAVGVFLYKWVNRPIPMDQLESEVIDLSTADYEPFVSIE